MLREIVHIDEDKCDGCGLCVPACEEGAIRLVNGKARLVAEVLCDGLGACLGHCPRGAIWIEKREAPAFDEAVVAAHLGALGGGHHAGHAPLSGHAQAPFGGCPSSRLQMFERPPAAPSGCPSSAFSSLGGSAAAPARPTTDEYPGEMVSELTHWPVQLHLLAPGAPVLRGARLLLAADCVPVAYADFHRRFLRGRAVIIACPKLDDTSTYLDKLTEMIRLNEPAEITVLHMEVPCCTGILHLAMQAIQRSGKAVPLVDVVISRDGRILAERTHTGTPSRTESTC